MMENTEESGEICNECREYVKDSCIIWAKLTEVIEILKNEKDINMEMYNEEINKDNEYAGYCINKADNLEYAIEVIEDLQEEIFDRFTPEITLV